MKGLIVSSGEIKNYRLLKDVADAHNYIICADGGLDHLLEINKAPDLVVGDLDSISSEALEFIKEKNIRLEKYPTAKDNTDTELALNFMIKRDIKEISLMGVTGSRIDHTISGMLLLRKLSKQNIKACAIDDTNRIYFVDNKIDLRKRKDCYVSVIPLNFDGICISMKGFLYSLDKEHIEFASTLGVSNRITESYGKIQIHKGEALIIESKD